jgi:Cu/Ag efflux protein CusF
MPAFCRMPTTRRTVSVRAPTGPMGGRPPSADACHGKNGAVDNTFVQFYPTLIPVALEKGTFREEAAGNQNAPVKSYVFHGKVESLNTADGSLKVNGDKVDGWMDAMTMDYKVDDPSVLRKLKTGDRIKAKVYDGDFVTLHSVAVESAPQTK